MILPDPGALSDDKLTQEDLHLMVNELCAEQPASQWSIITALLRPWDSTSDGDPPTSELPGQPAEPDQDLCEMMKEMLAKMSATTAQESYEDSTRSALAISDAAMLEFKQSMAVHQQQSIGDRATIHEVFIIAAAVLFAIGVFGNLLVLGSVLRTGILRIRIRLLLLCLCFADLFCIFIEFPTQQFVWLSEYDWTLGSAACRLMAFLRAHCFYLIAYVLVAISLDRYFNVTWPLNSSDAFRRASVLLGVAWLFSAAMAIPQTFMFNVREKAGLMQCIQVGFENNFTQQLVYSIFSVALLYIAPLCLIYWAYRMTNERLSRPSFAGGSTRSASTCSRSSAFLYGPRKGSLIPPKGRVNALRTCLYTFVAFGLCWLPYVALLLWFVCTGATIPFEAYKSAELLAVANACVNPYIFGNYILRVTRRRFLRFLGLGRIDEKRRRLESGFRPAVRIREPHTL